MTFIYGITENNPVGDLFPSVVDTNEDGLTFDQWQLRVDNMLLGMCGLTADDLADYPSYDLWADGVSPKEAAMICLEDWNDFPSDLF